MSSTEMRIYLTNLIENNGSSIDDFIPLEDHIGLTWDDLIWFIDTVPHSHKRIREDLFTIDYYHSDIFEYLLYLSKSMIDVISDRLEYID